MLDQVNRRFLYGFLLVAGFGACSYDAPSVGDVTAASSSSSSSGIGGAGGHQSTSSNGGHGGDGLIPLGGMGGGIGVGGMLMTGVGGAGDAVTSAVSSSSSSSGGNAKAVVENCGNGDCPTAEEGVVCCKSKTAGGSSNCEMFSGVCLALGTFALKCDDKADCGLDAFCCMSGFDRATCSSDCGTDKVVCKSKLDCPLDQECNVTGDSVLYCGPK